MFPRHQIDIDARHCLAAALTPPLGDAAGQRLRRQITRWWPYEGGRVIALSVRTAWDLWLRAQDFPLGTRILMSGLTLPAMAEIVRLNGLEPVGVDIDLKTLLPAPEMVASAANTPGAQPARVLLVAHLFGAQLDLAPLARACEQLGLILVEDAAQAFDGTPYMGHPASDAILFSFGPIKSATALGGAVALVRQPAIAARMQEMEHDYPSAGEGWFRRRALKFLAIALLGRPFPYALFLLAMRTLGRDAEALMQGAVRGFPKGIDFAVALRRRPPAGMLALLAQRLSEANPAKYAERGRIARKFLQRLPPTLERPGTSANQHTHWVVPIMPANPAASLASLRRAGFDASTGTTSMRPIADLPEAVRFKRQVLYLPVRPDIPHAALDKMARCLGASPVDRNRPLDTLPSKSEPVVTSKPARITNARRSQRNRKH